MRDKIVTPINNPFFIYFWHDEETFKDHQILTFSKFVVLPFPLFTNPFQFLPLRINKDKTNYVGRSKNNLEHD